MPLTHQMRELVTIEKRTQTQDAAGYPVESWQPVGQFWAKKLYKSGGLREQEMEVTSFEKVDFVLRTNPSLNTEYRIIYEGEYYEIKAADFLLDRSGYKVTTERRGKEWAN